MGGIAEKLLTLEEAAHRLDRTPDELQTAIREGRLSAFRLGGTLLRIRSRDLDLFLKAQQAVPEKAAVSAPKEEPEKKPKPKPLPKKPQQAKKKPEQAKNRPKQAQSKPESAQKETQFVNATPESAQPAIAPVSTYPPTVSSGVSVSSASGVSLDPAIEGVGPWVLAWDRVVDFLYFNDFYLIGLLIFLTLLAIIFLL
jgi:excisionase family DNA binding protein